MLYNNIDQPVLEKLRMSHTSRIAQKISKLCFKMLILTKCHMKRHKMQCQIIEIQSVILMIYREFSNGRGIRPD